MIRKQSPCEADFSAVSDARAQSRSDVVHEHGRAMAGRPMCEGWICRDSSLLTEQSLNWLR
jgi:hypothetical protein